MDNRDRLSDNGDAALNWMGTSPRDSLTAWNLANPLQNSASLRTVNVCLAHGLGDQDVPFTYSEAFVEHLSHFKSKNQLAIPPLIAFENGDHYSLVDSRHNDWDSIKQTIMNAINQM